MVGLIGFIIGYLIGVILSAIVDDLTGECLLYYMILPFAWILKQLKWLFYPLSCPKLTIWSIKHKISPYAKVDKFYELNDDDWNEAMDKFCKNRSTFDRLRNTYLEQDEKR